MRAVVRYAKEPGALELRDVPSPKPGPGEVLMAVEAAGVCGSDLEAFHAEAYYPVPVIPGHEFSGTVVEVGEGVRGFGPGDRVVSETHAYVCGRCAMCRSGHYNICPERRGFGFLANGAFAELVVTPERCLHRVPDNLDLTEAAMTEPVCVTYNALVRKSRIAPGDVVVVIGAGPIGLMAVQVARVCGATDIVLAGLEVDDLRLKVGLEVGATRAVNVEQESLEEVVRRLGDGLGADLVVDAAGPPAAVAQAMDVVRQNGQITKIAWEREPLNHSLDPLVRKAASIQGTFSHTWETWERSLRLMAAGQIRLAPMVTHRFPLEEWREAYRTVDDRTATKAVLLPSCDGRR